MSDYSKLLATLDRELEIFIRSVNEQKLTNMATDKWNTKDILSHVAFWHKYYADQYQALAKGKKPFVFKSGGGANRNQEGVNSLRNLTKTDLIKMLKKSQLSLQKSITTKNIPSMDYTNKKRYTTKEFLEIVTGHIKRHTDQIRKAK